MENILPDKPTAPPATHYKAGIPTIVLDRDFHFAFPMAIEYTPECGLTIFFAFVPTAKTLSCPAGPLPRPKSHDLPDFESISRTLRWSYRPPCAAVWRGGSSHSGNPGSELEVRSCLEMSMRQYGTP